MTLVVDPAVDAFPGLMAISGESRSTTERRIRRGDISTFKVGRRVRTTLSEIERFRLRIQSGAA